MCSCHHKGNKFEKRGSKQDVAPLPGTSIFLFDLFVTSSTSHQWRLIISLPRLHVHTIVRYESLFLRSIEWKILMASSTERYFHCKSRYRSLINRFATRLQSTIVSKVRGILRGWLGCVMTELDSHALLVTKSSLLGKSRRPISISHRHFCSVVFLFQHFADFFYARTRFR